MNQTYLQLREEARKIVAALPAPQFYQRFIREITYSRQMLHSHPLLVKIKKEINPLVEDDFGHGLHHSDLVCVDAGAIILLEMGSGSEIESKSEPSVRNRSPVTMQEQPGNTTISKETGRKILLVQVAGLLHDIKRKEKKHSIKGAQFARTFLSTGGYPITIDEIDTICSAIREHEAFQKEKQEGKIITDNGSVSLHDSFSLSPSLISNALYDADKFRWGPDNFTHTLWDMAIFLNAPVTEFIKRYPDGMTILEQIKSTFRTDTGKKYGPDFIDLGIEAGNRLFKIITRSNMITGQ